MGHILKFLIMTFEYTARRFCTTLQSFLILLVLSTAAQAELYKWVDEKGNTHYSDETPETKKHSIIKPSETTNQQALNRNNNITPILLPDGKSSRKILLSKGYYHWKNNNPDKQKLGVYYLGQFCSSRGAIYASDVYSNHPRFIPNEHGIPKTIKSPLVKMGYDAYISEAYDLRERMRSLNGLYLRAEIIELDLQTCAPIYNLMRAITPKKLPWSNFTKNRVSLDVRWQLFDNMDQPALFDSITSGYFDNWNTNKKPHSTIEQALQVAVNNLLANQEFIDLITTTESNNKMAQKRSPRDHQEESWWQKIIPQMDNSIGELLNQQYSDRARVAAVLAEANSIKINAINYYLSDGKWPIMVQEIGLNDRIFEDHKLISGINFDFDGTFTLHLRESVFGTSRVLRMTPDAAGYEDGRSTGINWSCSSNLSQHSLPEGCEAL